MNVNSWQFYFSDKLSQNIIYLRQIYHINNNMFDAGSIKTIFVLIISLLIYVTANNCLRILLINDKIMLNST